MIYLISFFPFRFPISFFRSFPLMRKLVLSLSSQYIESMDMKFCGHGALLENGDECSMLPPASCPKNQYPRSSFSDEADTHSCLSFALSHLARCPTLRSSFSSSHLTSSPSSTDQRRYITNTKTPPFQPSNSSENACITGEDDRSTCRWVQAGTVQVPATPTAQKLVDHVFGIGR